MYQKLEEEGK